MNTTPTPTTPAPWGDGPGDPGGAINRVWIILRKEFREIFRDRRTIMGVIVGPLIITPALFYFIGIMAKSQVEKAQTQQMTIGVVHPERAPNLVDMLQRQPNLKVTPVAQEDAEARIKKRDLNAVVILPADAVSKMEAGQTLALAVLEDQGEQNSQIAAGRVKSAFAAMGEQVVADRLRVHQLPSDYAHPFKIEETPIKSGGNTGSFFLTMMLPYVLALAAFGGAIYAAFDQVAGEKERGTLETLLVSPASRRDIVLGKFGAVVGVCLVSCVLSIVGLILAFSTRSKAMSALAEGGLHLSPAAAAVVLLVMLPMSVMFAGLLLTVSTYARNQKEAQTYLSPLMMLVVVPSMASMFVGADASRSLAFVPILGSSVIIKQALSGTFDVLFIVLAFGASALYAGLAIAVATYLFQKEAILIKA